MISPTLVSIAQTGPLACTITFSKAWVPFPYYLAGGIGGQIAYPVAPSMLANPNGTSHPVGTGPFVFQQWVPNDHFTATANPHYWRPGLPHLSKITFKPIPDESARAEALKSGTIDLMITDTPQIITQFRGNKSYSYVDDSGKVAGEPDMNCVQLNCLKAPFNNANVRRAAAMAINRKQYAKVIDDNVLPVSTGLFTPGSPYFSTTSYPAYNQSEARNLVKTAEKQTGRDPSASRSAPPTRRPPSGPRSTSSRRGRPSGSRSRTRSSSRTTTSTRPWRAPTRRWPGASSAPSTRTSTTSSGARPPSVRAPCPSTWPATRTPRSRPPCWPGGRPPSSRSARHAYKTVNKRLAIDLPYLWTDRAVWAVIGNPTVQNFDNPTSPQGQNAFGLIGGSIWPTQIWIS